MKNKKRTYTEGEVRRIVKKATEEAVAEMMVLSIVACRDVCKMDGSQITELAETMERYYQYHQEGIISLEAASDSLEKRTGVKLRRARWK